MRKIISIIVIAVMLVGIASIADAGRRHHHRRGHKNISLGKAAASIAVLGGVLIGLSALDRAVNPPRRPKVIYVQPNIYKPVCRSAYDCEYEREMEKIRRQRQKEYEKWQRQKARNDARRDSSY